MEYPPLLFSVYFNPTPNPLLRSKTHLFVDVSLKSPASRQLSFLLWSPTVHTPKPTYLPFIRFPLVLRALFARKPLYSVAKPQVIPQCLHHEGLNKQTLTHCHVQHLHYQFIGHIHFFYLVSHHEGLKNKLSYSQDVEFTQGFYMYYLILQHPWRKA